MARLNDMLKALQNLEGDRRLSYLGPQPEPCPEGEVDDQAEPQKADEGFYSEREFIKEAQQNPKRLFDFIY